MTASEALQKLLDAVGKVSSAPDPTEELARLAYWGIVDLLKLKGLKDQIDASIRLHQALRMKHETGDTSLLEKLVNDHFAGKRVP